MKQIVKEFRRYMYRLDYILSLPTFKMHIKNFASNTLLHLRNASSGRRSVMSFLCCRQFIYFSITLNEKGILCRGLWNLHLSKLRTYFSLTLLQSMEPKWKTSKTSYERYLQIRACYMKNWRSPYTVILLLKCKIYPIWVEKVQGRLYIMHSQGKP